MHAAAIDVAHVEVPAAIVAAVEAMDDDSCRRELWTVADGSLATRALSTVLGSNVGPAKSWASVSPGIKDVSGLRADDRSFRLTFLERPKYFP